MKVNDKAQVTLSYIMIFIALHFTTKVVSFGYKQLSNVNQGTAQAAVQTPIRSQVNLDYLCVVYDEQNTCYVWYNRTTGKYYDSQGNEVASPFP